MNTVPMYEAKNKLPLFMHQAEESGPVFISRRNKTVGVILSFDDYNKLLSKQPKRTILEAAEEFRKKTAGMNRRQSRGSVLFFDEQYTQRALAAVAGDGAAGADLQDLVEGLVRLHLGLDQLEILP